MRVLITDLVSPSYFVATAAVELGFLAARRSNVTDLLDHGGAVVLEDARIRTRLLPIGRGEPSG